MQSFKAASASFRAGLAGVFLLALASGCREQREIETYVVDAPDRPSAESMRRDAPDATLVAIVTREKALWFFKLTGPTEAVSRYRDDFNSVIQSVHFEKREPKWSLPAGWKEDRSREMRLATLTPSDAPDAEETVELSISALGRPAPLAILVESNVNRWRRQLSTAPTTQAEIADSFETVATGAGDAMVFYFTGKLQESATPVSRTGATARAPRKTPKENGKPPDAAAAPPVARRKPAAVPIQFKAPDSWAPGKTNAMVRIAFSITDGPQQATVRASRIPVAAGPQTTSLVANLTRWRRQVGLPPVEPAAARAAFEKIDLGGIAGDFIALDGPEDASPRMAMRVLMVRVKNQIWFFKLSGPIEVVERESERFRTFLASVQFENPTNDSESPDGD